MYKLCKTEQSARRQQELEQALLAQMQMRHFDDISVSDLCEQMNIPRKAFYRYFSGKKGALHALLDHALLEFEQEYSSFSVMSPEMRHRTLVDFFRFWKEHRNILDALKRSELLATLVGRTTQVVFQTGNSRKDVPGSAQWKEKMYFTSFAVCGVMSVVLNWYQSEFAESEEAMASITEKMIVTSNPGAVN